MTAVTAPAVKTSRNSVLIVEDEKIARRALAAILNFHGYETEAVGSAEEAMGMMRVDHPHPHLAVIDLDLPGMNGLDLISHLEKIDPSLYPVLVTGASTDRLEAVLKKRHVECLRKPVDLRRLLLLLEKNSEASDTDPS